MRFLFPRSHALRGNEGELLGTQKESSPDSIRSLKNGYGHVR